MKKLAALLCAIITFAASARTLTGIEVLRNDGFDILKGKRIGLVTNPTGVDAQLNSTIDILHGAPGVELVALFAPEHGVRGDVAAGARVANTTDPATGVKVYSLFGSTTKPTAEMLKNIDVMVYDIQDIGCRSYTFISTLGKVMEACAENGVELVVLDRPNPLGGNKVEGPAKVDADCRSFVSRFDIPYVYGLTVGELAKYLNRNDECNLTVVPMEGWSRAMTFNETGLPWVPTSPNIPTAETALYYPATGILGELSTLWNGANFTQPFKVVAGDNVDAAKLAAKLNALNLKGVSFRPYHARVNGKSMHGVEIYILDPVAAEITEIQFHILEQLPWAVSNATASRMDMFNKVTGSKRVAAAFKKRNKAADVIEIWRTDPAGWREATEPFLLYD